MTRMRATNKNKMRHSKDTRRRRPKEANEASRAGGSRKILRQLDRELQRFSNRVAALENRANRSDLDEGGDLLVAVESLHRETLLLRAEIRQYLADGGPAVEQMIDYVQEAREQLQESLDELAQSFAPLQEVAEESDSDGEDQDTDEWFEDSWVQDDDELEGDLPPLRRRDVHAPRLGPKR